MTTMAEGVGLGQNGLIMTEDKQAKQAIRNRMALTGESYSTARRAVLNPEIAAGAVSVFLPDHCANCLEWLPEGEEGLFCSPWCQETTKHVRYFRRVFRDGRIEDPDVQQAVRTRLAFLPSGGYAALGRNLSPQTREAVKKRDKGKCQRCGKEGSEIDHISGSSPELSNLQLLCPDCHKQKTAANMVPASAEIRALIDSLMSDRVFPDTPRLLADDEKSWDGSWRQLKKERRQRLLDELEALDIDPTGLKTRADMILERDDAISEYDDNPEYGPGSYFEQAMQRDD